MNTCARNLLVPEGADCMVQAVARCVRRAWLRERVKHLVEAFAIKVCSFAIMSNHSHFDGFGSGPTGGASVALNL